jgi:hypothetical protein
MLICCLAYFSTLKVEATHPWTSAEVRGVRCNPEDGTIHSHRCGNLKSGRLNGAFQRDKICRPVQTSLGILSVTLLLKRQKLK